MMNTSDFPSGLRGLVAAGVFVVLAASPSIVSAADPSNASRSVKYTDLDISSPSGAHVLYMRILAGAQVVCSYYAFATDADKARCVRDSIANAVTEIDQPALSAVYNAVYKTTHETPAPGSRVSQNR